jgi:hypothetical protein
MKALLPLFSASKIDVLYILYTAAAPVHLRGIQSLSELSLRPVQLALQDLTKRKILRKFKHGKYLFYEIQNLPNPLRLLFDSLVQEERERFREALLDDAKSLGLFQEDAFRMIQNRR